MEDDGIQMYSIRNNDDQASREPVVLRALVGDPHRHSPRVQHAPRGSPRIVANEEVTMYTLNTPQPIPTKALPKHNQPKVYYIDTKFGPPPEGGARPVIETTVGPEPRVGNQPIVYNIVGSKPRPIVEQRIPKTQEPSVPVIYTIVGRPRRSTMDIEQAPTPAPKAKADPPPILYTVTATPRLPSPQPSQQPSEPTPSLYSISDAPARTSRGIQVNVETPNDPAPILYTVVNDTPDSRDMEKENRPPPKPRKKADDDIVIYGPDNEVYTSDGEQPTLYAVVAKPASPPIHLASSRTKLTPRKGSPSPAPTNSWVNDRFGRNLDRRQEPLSEDIISYPSEKTSIPTASKDSTPTKAETTVIRSRDYTEAPPLTMKSNKVTPYQPMPILPYRASHAYRTQKPHQDRKTNQTILPVISNTRPDRRAKGSLHESHYRSHQMAPMKPTSLERGRTRTMNKSRLGQWDYHYQAQTDDDEIYEERLNKKKRPYQAPRARAPWVPVW